MALLQKEENKWVWLSNTEQPSLTAGNTIIVYQVTFIPYIYPQTVSIDALFRFYVAHDIVTTRS
jgi:hypothetical protein